MRSILPGLAAGLFFLFILSGCQYEQRESKSAVIRYEHGKEAGEEEEEYDGPGLAMQLEFEKTKDPETGRVPRELLWPVIEYTDQLKQDIRSVSAFAYAKTANNGWMERGPNSDSRGSNNGNFRGPNNDITSGRIRAVLVDASDANGNTVWVGGICGGLWKTTNITSNPAGWILVNDKLSNLVVTGICQNPVSTSTMYFCTGEGNYNADAVQGDGVFKSTDGGNTWSQLSSTTGSGFDYCSRIICDASGNVYVGTHSGIYRSTNGGTSWTNITPSGISTGVCDMKISSTGRLHLVTGFGSTAYYRFTDNPSTVTSSTGWTSATISFTTASVWRVILACQGSDLIALPSNSSTHEVGTIFKSSDGGANWSATSASPSFTSGQGWYCLAAAINPANTSHYIVGSLNCYKSTNSGANWSQISDWASSTLQYVHADQQDLYWYTASSQSRVIAVSDGGIHLSTDGGSTWADRNSGLRIKQFYSCAIHPTSGSNYMLAGAQDNGVHALSNAGLSSSVEVTGGDGAFVHIDQNEPQYQFGSYVYNNYRRSTNTGTSWGGVVLNSGTGLFINPTDYDNTANIMYCSEGTGGYRRWTNPQSGNTSDAVAVTALSSGSVYAVTVSPYTSNRIYLGTASGILARVDNAHNVTSPAAGSAIASGLGAISSIVYGGSEDTVLVTTSGYSGTQVWYSTNATSGTPTFTAKDGTLPNMPVRWSLPVPNTFGKRVMVATETGVWVTKDITAASPAWVPDPTFPNVRTDMLKYRSSDKIVVAATHGRGLWTAIAQEAASIALPNNEFVLKGTGTSNANTLNWTFKTVRQSIRFEVERSDDGRSFEVVNTQQGGAGRESYSYTEARKSSWQYYRVRSIDQYGLTQYTNVVSIAPNTGAALQVSNVYPSPARDIVNLTIASPAAETVRLELYSVSGQKVRHLEQALIAGSQNVSMNVSGILPGNYLMVTTVGRQRYSHLVVKQ